MEKIPIFVPTGSIIPMGSKVQYSEKAWEDPWELRVYEGRDAEFDIYEDSGDGYDYEDGDYSFTPVAWDDCDRKLTVHGREGSFPEIREEREFNIVRVEKGFGIGVEKHAGRKVTYNGEKIEIRIRDF